MEFLHALISRVLASGSDMVLSDAKGCCAGKIGSCAIESAHGFHSDALF